MALKSKTAVQTGESDPEAVKPIAAKLPAKRKSPAKVSVSKIFPEKEIPMAQIEKTNVDHHMAKKYLTKYLDRELTNADIDKATIIMGCWIKDIDPSTLEQLREGAKADLAAARLGEATRLCIEAARPATKRDVTLTAIGPIETVRVFAER